MRVLTLLLLLAVALSASRFVILFDSSYKVGTGITDLVFDNVTGSYLAIASATSGASIVDLNSGEIRTVVLGGTGNVVESVSYPQGGYLNAFVFILKNGKVVLSDFRGNKMASYYVGGGHAYDGAIGYLDSRVPHGFIACRFKCAFFDVLGNKVWEVDVGDVEANPLYYNGYWYVIDYSWKKLLIIKDGSIVNRINYGETPYDIAMCRGKRYLAVVTEHHLYLYDLSIPTSPRVLWKKALSGSARSVAISPNCKYIAVADNVVTLNGADMRVELYDIKGNPLSHLSFGHTGHDRVMALAMSNMRLAVALEDGRIYIYKYYESVANDLKSFISENRGIILQRLIHKKTILENLYEHYFNRDWYISIGNRRLNEIYYQILHDWQEYLVDEFAIEDTYDYLDVAKDIALAAIDADVVGDLWEYTKGLIYLFMIDVEMERFYETASISDWEAKLTDQAIFNCDTSGNLLAKAFAIDECIERWSAFMGNSDPTWLIDRYNNLRFYIYGMLRMVEKEIEALRNNNVDEFMKYLKYEKAFGDAIAKMFNTDEIKRIDSYMVNHVFDESWRSLMIYITIVRKGFIMLYDLVSLSELLDYPLLKYVDPSVNIIKPKLKLSDNKYWYTLVVKYSLFNKNGRKMMRLEFFEPEGYAYKSTNSRCQIKLILACKSKEWTSIIFSERRKEFCIDTKLYGDLKKGIAYTVDVTEFLDPSKCEDPYLEIRAVEPYLVNYKFMRDVKSEISNFASTFGFRISVYDKYFKNAEIMRIDLNNVKLGKVYLGHGSEVYHPQLKTFTVTRTATLVSFTEYTTSLCTNVKTTLVTRTSTIPVITSLTRTITTTFTITEISPITSTMYTTVTYTTTKLVPTTITTTYTTTKIVNGSTITITKTETIPTTITETRTFTSLKPTVVTTMMTTTREVISTVVETIIDTLITTLTGITTLTSSTTITTTELISIGKKIPAPVLLVPITIALRRIRKNKHK